MTGPTPLDPTTRYIRPGITKVYWTPTLAAPASPTRVELDASTDLSHELADVAGFTVASNTVDVPDWGNRYTAKAAGMITADDSSLTFYASQDTQDVRTILTRDQKGFVVWMDGGDVAAQLMDVFPVTITAVSKLRTTSDPAQVMVSFAITSVPSENVVIPT